MPVLTEKERLEAEGPHGVGPAWHQLHPLRVAHLRGEQRFSGGGAAPVPRPHHPCRGLALMPSKRGRARAGEAGGSGGGGGGGAAGGPPVSPALR